MILGITGGTGCGKTTLLRCIAQAGGVILDCDEIYHDLLRADPELLQAIEERFPGTVKNGVLLRKVLGERVFSDETALADLNRITHSAVKAEVLHRLESCPRRKYCTGWNPAPLWRPLTPLPCLKAAWHHCATSPWPSLPPRKTGSGG